MAIVECPNCGSKTCREVGSGGRWVVGVAAGLVASFAIAAACWASLVALAVEPRYIVLRFLGLALTCGAVGVAAGVLALRSARRDAPGEFVCDVCAYRWMGPRNGAA